VGVGVAAALVYAWRNPDLGVGIIKTMADLNLPLLGDFFSEPPDWAKALAGYLAAAFLAWSPWIPVSAFWNWLMRQDEKTFFSGVSRPLWNPASWVLFLFLVLPIASVVYAVLFLFGEPVLAKSYLLASILTTLLVFAVFAGGGKTYASDDTADSTLVATARIGELVPLSFPLRLAIMVLIAVGLVLVPLVVAWGFPDWFPFVFGIEIALVISALVAETIRKSLVFWKRFNYYNDRLPRPPKRT
jgi:hypothetical protein